MFKRSLLTEAAGIPVGLEIEGANRHDMKLATDMLARVPQAIEDKRLEHLATGEEQGLCMDAGYDYNEVRESAEEFGYTTHIRARGEEKKASTLPVPSSLEISYYLDRLLVILLSRTLVSLSTNC